jgi:hypothetical protein
MMKASLRASGSRFAAAYERVKALSETDFGEAHQASAERQVINAPPMRSAK